VRRQTTNWCTIYARRQLIWARQRALSGQPHTSCGSFGCFSFIFGEQDCATTYHRLHIILRTIAQNALPSSVQTREAVAGIKRCNVFRTRALELIQRVRNLRTWSFCEAERGLQILLSTVQQHQHQKSDVKVHSLAFFGSAIHSGEY
jgi:hypothetical protein